jgi:hypothetical protein
LLVAFEQLHAVRIIRYPAAPGPRLATKPTAGTAGTPTLGCADSKLGVSTQSAPQLPAVCWRHYALSVNGPVR